VISSAIVLPQTRIGLSRPFALLGYLLAGIGIAILLVLLDEH
jgi:hypothetical protein